MTPWLHIIGIGEDGFDALRPVARTTIDAAEICYGGARHLAMLPESFTGERRRWRTPLRDTFEDIKTLAGRQVVVLATGDPMNFGVGTTLIRELSDSIGPDALRVTPAPGAFSLAAARMVVAAANRLPVHSRAAFIRAGAPPLPRRQVASPV